jgi:hypothetical protein
MSNIENIEQEAGALSHLSGDCKLCKSRVKDWHGSDPVCAFNGAFKENWNCATVSLIRDICYEGQTLKHGVDYQYCDDQKYATIKTDDIEGLDRALALWVSWYKNRGATDIMYLLFSGKPPRVPTEQECVLIAEYYNKI